MDGLSLIWKIKKKKKCDGCNKYVDKKILRRVGPHGMYCPTCKENKVGYVVNVLPFY